MVYDVCIIGGGASGLAAAIAARKEKASVLVIERMEKVGKKILATGNGKCNLTNTAIIRRRVPVGNYRSKNRRFPMEVINQFDAKDTLSFFESIGLYTKNREDYVYPLSEQAAAVSDILKWQLATQKADIVTGEEVKSVQVSKNHSARFTVKTEKNTYKAKQLIIAAGGQSDTKLGSNGTGYELCKKLGHKIVPVVPALTALKCKEKYFKELAGIRLKGSVQVVVDGRMLAEDAGELQLTAYGISGIPVFQVSRYAAYGLLEHRNVKAVLDLMSEIDRETLFQRLKAQMKVHPQWHMSMILSGFINKKLAACLLKLVHANEDKPCQTIKDETLRQLVSLLKHMEVTIVETNGFEQSQVSAGGVDTREIDSYNMASKIVEGLYIVGELLDVEGICGGYNLQWAWATGILAGNDAGRRAHS